MKSLMTLNRSLWRLASQVQDFAERRNQTLVEYRQGFVYCFELCDLCTVFEAAPDRDDVIAVYNCKDAMTWRKQNGRASASTRKVA